MKEKATDFLRQVNQDIGQRGTGKQIKTNEFELVVSQSLDEKCQ